MLKITHRGTTVLMLGHTNSERGYLRDHFAEELQKKLQEELEPNKWTVKMSDVDRDPLYVV